MKILTIFLVAIFITRMSDAYEEQWLILQQKAQLTETDQALLEYVRRDRSDLFQKKNLELVRMSWVKPVQAGSLLLGMAYIDFATAQPETRLHQFLIKKRRSKLDSVFMTTKRMV